MTAKDAISIPLFEILIKLSSGGMGDVLLARRKGAHGFEKLVAIKTIKEGLAKRDDIRKMFLDEARLVARLDHPAIAQVYDFGEENEALYLAMEYATGIGLNRLLVKRQAALPVTVALSIVAEVCRGIHAAHELTDHDGRALGVVHRDLSPGNLILTFDGRLKILDFGIAFMNERESPDTQLGELKGKPSYMAPEQLRAEPVDRRSDLYSLSVVLHEMLTGRKLFRKNNVVATALAVERGDVPHPSAFNPECIPQVDALVMCGLERDPGRRFQDAKTMALAVDAVLAKIQGPTLEQFVENQLQTEQETHKRWLSAVLAGDYAEPGTYETYDETKLRIPAPSQHEATRNDSARRSTKPLSGPAAAPLVESTTLVPSAETGDVVQLESKPRGSRTWLLLGLALSLLLVFGASALLRNVSGTEVTPIPPVEAGNTAALPTSTPELAEPAPPPAEPTPVADVTETPPEGDAKAWAPDRKRTKRTTRRNKRRRRQTTKPPPPPPPPAKLTFGFVTIGANPYALVRIDGKDVGVTPLVRQKLTTGTHRIELVSPDSGETRLSKKVKITEGKHQRITIP